MKQKSLLTTLLLIIGLGAYTVLNTSYSSGFTTYRSSCGGCHGSANAATTVAINAPTFYAPGTSYPITVTVTNTGAANNQAGFQIQSSIGTLSTTDPDVTVQGGNVSAGHNKRKAMVSNTATFNLIWTAPTPGGAAVNFTAVGNAVNGDFGSSNADQWNFAPTTSVALPVNFTNVTAQQLESHVLINFKTNSEVNVESFSIERGIDGNNFESIGTILPNGAGSYDYQDFTAKQGVQYYYKIKETSLDQNITYSPVVKTSTNSKGNISIYPTVLDNNRVTLSGIDLKDHLDIAMFDLVGKIIFTKSVESNVVVIPNLTTGYYFIAVKQNGKVIKTQKVFKK